MTNKERLQEALTLANQGDVAAFEALLDDNITWRMIGQTEYSGIWHSKYDLLHDLAARVRSKIVGATRMTYLRFIEQDGVVVVESVGAATTVDGERYDNHYCEVFTFRDGKITDAKIYLDTDLIRRVH